MSIVIFIGLVVALVVGIGIGIKITKDKIYDDMNEVAKAHLVECNRYELVIDDYEQENDELKKALIRRNREVDDLKKKLDDTKRAEAAAKSLNTKLQSKLDDLAGDTAHLMDLAKEEAPVKKKRKYTRKRKPAAKK